MFFTSCEATEFAETEHRREACPEYRPLSTFIDGAPRLAAGVREVKEVTAFSQQAVMTIPLKRSNLSL